MHMRIHSFKEYWAYYIVSNGTTRHWFPFLRGKIVKKYTALKTMHRNANQFAGEHRIAREDLRNNRQALREFFNRTTLEDYWKYYVLSNDAPHYHLPWEGQEMTKFPADIIIYKDLIDTSKPEVVIEIGTQRGISALFLASLVKPYGGLVITIDIKEPPGSTLEEFQKQGIMFVHGDATTVEIATHVKKLVGGKKCFIIDDGSHRHDDVLSAFALYGECVPIGGYFAIEDGMTNWLVQNRDYDALGAVDEIVRTNADTWRRYSKYDAFIFFSMYQGILQKIN